MIISNKVGLQQPHVIHYGRLELNITLMTMKGVTSEKLDVKVERKGTQYKEASPSQLACNKPTSYIDSQLQQCN